MTVGTGESTVTSTVSDTEVELVPKHVIVKYWSLLKLEDTAEPLVDQEVSKGP